MLTAVGGYYTNMERVRVAPKPCFLMSAEGSWKDVEAREEGFNLIEKNGALTAIVPKQWMIKLCSVRGM